MASVKLKLNKSRALKDGSYPVVFQLIHRRCKKVLYTKYHMKEAEFTPILERVNTHDGNVSEIIRSLNKTLNLLNTQIERLEAHGDDYTINDITSVIITKPAKQYILLEFIDSQIAWKKSMNKNGTAAAYQSTRSSLEKFIGQKQLRMSQINKRFVIRYIDFLYKNQACKNTVTYYVRNFRALYNLGIKDGFTPHYDSPFDKINTKLCKTAKRALTRKQMQSLKHFTSSQNLRLKLSLDIFLFGFYAQGMAFVDIAFLKWKNICGGIIKYRRHKSKQLIQIAITPQIQEILDEHGSINNDVESYVFPIIKSVINPKTDKNEYEQYRTALVRTNRHLRAISKKLNINPPLTTYMARHSWATLAREYGAPVSAISAGLGHTKEEMTLVYLKELDLTPLFQINNMINNLL